MQTTIAKIAFAVIVLCLLTLILGVDRHDSKPNTFQAAPISAIVDTAPVGVYNHQ